MAEVIFILKPEFTKYARQVDEYIEVHSLNILSQLSKVLSYAEIVCLYPEIFTNRSDDLEFGEEWKYDTIDYLGSGNSKIYHISGEGAPKKMKELKQKLRLIEHKDVMPPTKLSRQQFIDLSIKNVAHTVDPLELNQMLWLFKFISQERSDVK